MDLLPHLLRGMWDENLDLDLGGVQRGHGIEQSSVTLFFYLYSGYGESGE